MLKINSDEKNFKTSASLASLTDDAEIIEAVGSERRKERKNITFTISKSRIPKRLADKNTRRGNNETRNIRNNELEENQIIIDLVQPLQIDGKEIERIKIDKRPLNGINPRDILLNQEGNSFTVKNAKYSIISENFANNPEIVKKHNTLPGQNNFIISGSSLVTIEQKLAEFRERLNWNQVQARNHAGNYRYTSDINFSFVE